MAVKKKKLVKKSVKKKKTKPSIKKPKPAPQKPAEPAGNPTPLESLSFKERCAAALTGMESAFDSAGDKSYGVVLYGDFTTENGQIVFQGTSLFQGNMLAIADLLELSAEELRTSAYEELKEKDIPTQ